MDSLARGSARAARSESGSGRAGAAVPAKGRRPAARAAGRPTPCPTSIKLARDGDPRVRRRAAMAIGRVGLPEGVDALRAAASPTPTSTCVEAAAFGLGLSGDAPRAPTLLTLLGRRDRSRVGWSRGRAAEALGLIGERRLARSEPSIRERPRRRRSARWSPSLAATSAVHGVHAGRDAVAARARGRSVSARPLRAGAAEGATTRWRARCSTSRDSRRLRWWPVAYALQRLEDPRAVPALLTLLQRRRRLCARRSPHAASAR